MSIIVTVLVIFSLIFPHEADGVSNAGKTFFQTFNYNHPSVEKDVQHMFILSTDAETCDIAITVNGPPLTTDIVTVTNRKAVVYPLEVLANRGIKLSADCDFVVYGLNFAAASADGWMAMPVESLGTEYFILDVDPGVDEEEERVEEEGDATQLSIVAAYDNTTCTTTMADGTERVSYLNSTDVTSIMSQHDLTGTRVVCNNKVTVLSGQRCSQFPRGCDACDHTVEQVPPKSTLGRNFALVPTLQSCRKQPTCCEDPKFCEQCSEIFRILAVEDDTQILRNGTQTMEEFALNAGESRYILLSQTEFAHLLSTKPIILGQFFTGQDYDGLKTGDPAFTIVPQIESYSSRYQAATCFPQFKKHYFNLVLRKGTSDQLLLNEAPFLNPNSGHAIPGTDFEAFQYQYDCYSADGEPVSFTVEHAKKEPFGLFAYGFSPYISYAYPGGMNLNEDRFYKCAPPRINSTGENEFSLAACNLTGITPEFETPAFWTDEQCCEGNATLSYVDSVTVWSTCRKEILRTWALKDGCGRTIGLNQTAVVDQSLDSYRAMPNEVNFDGDCDAIGTNSTGTPEIDQDCGMTISVEFADVNDTEASVKRMWTIQQECANESINLEQLIRCGARNEPEVTNTTAPPTAVAVADEPKQPCDCQCNVCHHHHYHHYHHHHHRKPKRYDCDSEEEYDESDSSSESVED